MISIVFFGSDPWSIQVLKALEENFEVKVAVTAPDSAVANYFQGLVFTPNKLDEDFINCQLSIVNCQLFVVASYGKIIPQSLLDIPKYGALNVHPSLLPKFRGASPVPATILSGDKKTGVTIIKMDEKMDHGPVVAVKEISLSGQDDFPTLINTLFQLGADLLVKSIPDYISGKIQPKPQNHNQATFTKLMKKEDGYFDIGTPPDPETLDKMIRAYYPWPGVWTLWNEKIVKFIPTNVIPARRFEEASTLGVKEGIYINNFLIQMEGKKAISLDDFHNGYPDFPL